MKKLTKGYIYVIYWIDTFQALGWLDVDEMKEKCEENKSWIKTVGFYVGEMSGYYVFCSQFTDNEKMTPWSGMVAIPIGTIKKIQRL